MCTPGGQASTRSRERLDWVRQKGEVHPGASRGVNTEFKWKDSLVSVSALNTNLHFKRVSLAGPLQCNTPHCLWLEKHQPNVRLIMTLICSNSLGLFLESNFLAQALVLVSCAGDWKRIIRIGSHLMRPLVLSHFPAFLFTVSETDWCSEGPSTVYSLPTVCFSFPYVCSTKCRF